MKFLIGLFLMSALNANTPSTVDCSKWQSQVDASVVYSGTSPIVSKLNPEEKIQAISCLMELEGRRGAAKIGGVTRPDVSQILPEVSIEIAALFYIRFIYVGKWDHCDGIALMDKGGKLNKSSSVKKVFTSYKKWFEKVKALGIEEAKAKGLDPMDDCRDVVRWY